MEHRNPFVDELVAEKQASKTRKSHRPVQGGCAKEGRRNNSNGRHSPYGCATFVLRLSVLTVMSDMIGRR